MVEGAGPEHVERFNEAWGADEGPTVPPFIAMN